jgi:ComF family protein
MFLEALFNLIFPSKCLACGKNLSNGGVICEECFSLVRINQTLFCGRCLARLPEAKRICHHDFPYTLGAAASYGDETVKKLIHALKFQYSKAAAKPLGNLLVDYVNQLNLNLKNFIVVPLPLSSQRLKKRGFNQSELIAKIFANRFLLQIQTGCLVRSKNSKPQSETKNLNERRENIKGCFGIKSPDMLGGKNIILIDDVTTSGATLLEAAEVLKSAGVKKIIALTVAKA